MEIFFVIVIAVTALWMLYNSNTNRRDAPYVPSEGSVVEKMIHLADVKKGDTFYDLGSGDGRIVIAAAYCGALAFGIEADWLRVLMSRIWIRLFGLNKTAHILHQDIFKTDLSKADVISLFLLQETNEKLKDKLVKECKVGTRIVSYCFTFTNWKPTQIENIRESIYGPIYLYTIGISNIKKNIKSKK
jgi:SAM-dependent methyltransferase